MDISVYEAAKFPEKCNILDFDAWRGYPQKRAQDIFCWHQSVLRERVQYLLNVCSQDSGVSYEKLYSFPDGALPLWSWFLQVAEVVPVSPEEREKMYEKLAPQMAGHPENIVADVIVDLIPDKRLSQKTEEILWDIAMYVGDGFIRLSPKLHWELFRKPKSDVSYNHAVVYGFTPPGIIPGKSLWLEPLSMVRVQALHFVNGVGAAHDLQNMIMEWMPGA